MGILLQPRIKNLVMGFATNQSEESVRIFCQSLRTVYRPDECDIAVITNRHEPYFGELAAMGVRFHSTSNNYSARTSRATKAANRAVLHSFRLLSRLYGRRWLPEIAEAYPVLIETWHHPQLARWFAYWRLLSVNQIYQQVFFADVKDVVFQAPFFESISEDKVILFADANIYGNCYWNDAWYKEAYGKAAFMRVVGRQPVCIGTVLATQQAMLDILREFIAFMARSPFGRIEQAIFNHMLHTDMFKTKLEIAPNITGAVATLGSEAAFKAVKVFDGAVCRTSDNSIIPIVHMYDRWPGIDVLCTEKYASRLCQHTDTRAF
jgi:hypothetical protein